MEILFCIYILKSALCLSVFYLCYWLWLSKETFYRFNRLLLLGFLVIAFVIPSLKISQDVSIYQLSQVFEPLGTTVTGVRLPIVLNEEQVTSAVIPAMELEKEGSFSRIFTLDNLWTLYWCGVLFGACRYISFMVHIYRLIRRGEKRIWKDGIDLVIHQQNISPFSWRHYIVLSQKDLDEYGTEILVHEQAHIIYKHYGDLLLVDICCWLQWFNPAVWLLKSELKAIHEFEADESVLKGGIDAKQYQLLLIKKAVGTRLYSMVNHLSHNSLKKRITMMLKEKSNSRKLLKYFIVLPLVATTVVLFARPDILAGDARMNEMYQNIVSNDTLKPVVIKVLKSYAESDTVQILKVDLQNIPPLKKYNKSWYYATTNNHPSGVCQKVEFKLDGKGILRLFSSVSWTPEVLTKFTEEALKGLAETFSQPGEVSKDPTIIYSTTVESCIAIYEIRDFFNTYRENSNYKGQLILLDGKEISYQQLAELPETGILETLEALPSTTNLKKAFGKKAGNGILVVVTKKNPTYKKEFEKRLTQSN